MTLLEALVVIAITALISAIAFPKLHNFGDTARLRSESAALVADLHRARAAAIHLDRPITLTARADGWRWDGGEEHLAPPLRLTMPEPITFYPDGSASGGDATLASPGRSARVSIDRVTGLATVSGR